MSGLQVPQVEQEHNGESKNHVDCVIDDNACKSNDYASWWEFGNIAKIMEGDDEADKIEKTTLASKSREYETFEEKNCFRLVITYVYMRIC